ncbi:MAG: outer membrane beta-barrel protein [Bacteroidota bacterium]
MVSEHVQRVLLVSVLLVGLTTRSRTQTSDSPVEMPREVSTSLVNLNNGVLFEVSPHTGLMGGSGTFGLRLGMNYSSFHLELAGEQVIGKTANLYPISVNAILNLSTRSNLIPYGAVGVGLLLTVPTTSIGDETVSSIGFNFGGGARYYLTRNFGIRAEAKQYVTNVKNQRDQNDELLFFQEFTVGVAFMFR